MVGLQARTQTGKFGALADIGIRLTVSSSCLVLLGCRNSLPHISQYLERSVNSPQGVLRNFEIALRYSRTLGRGLAKT